jgi:hypothetical protein
MNRVGIRFQTHRRFRGQSFAAFLILFVIILFAFAILGDFSRAMAGWNKARDLADNAALAAANSIDAAHFNRGRTEINRELAKHRAQSIVSQWLIERYPEEKFIDLYLENLQISSPDVAVTVSGKVPAVFGNFFGIGSYPITVTSHAQLVVDIQAEQDQPPARCSYGGISSSANLTYQFDCLSDSITVTYQHEGSPARSVLYLPMLKVDSSQDMFPQKALAFTPILFAPQWAQGRAGHRVLAQGTYRVSDILEYRNISVYIQGVMTTVTNSAKWDSFVFSSDGLLMFGSDAVGPYKENYLFPGQNLNQGNTFLQSSPAWQLLSEEEGRFSYEDIPGPLYNSMYCNLSGMPNCGTTLNLSGIVSHSHVNGDISSFPKNQNLRSPDFIYLYPGESSRHGAYRDSATGQPAFGVSAVTAWIFYFYIEGDRWEYRPFTYTTCDPLYLPSGICIEKEYTYYKWVEIGWENIPGLRVPEPYSDNPWQVSRVIFNGGLSDSFPIPVYQAISILK